MIETELLIISLFIVIALIVSYILGKKRALRRARLDREYEMQLKEWEERRLAAQRKRALHAKQAPTARTLGTHVPQDATLRRHYQNHLRSMLVSLSSPSPTDSALKRHYETQLASELEHCLVDESRAQRLIEHYTAYRRAITKSTAGLSAVISPQPDKAEVVNSYIPQDATLKRHFIGHLRSMLEALAFSRPTDSTLQRHYETLIKTELDKCLADEEQITRLLRNYQNHKKTFTRMTHTAHQAVRNYRTRIPEDSTLRRHFIAGLRAMIESNKAARPSDSVLRRHYDTMIETELHLTLEQIGA